MKNEVRVPKLHPCIVLLILLGGVAIASESPVLSHFSWNNVASPQQAGALFPIQVSARDINGNLVSDFSGSIAVSAWSTRALPPLLITEIDVGANDRVELSNPTDLPQDVGGLQISFYDSTTWPSPRFTFSLPLGAVCPAGGVLELRASAAAGGSFPLFFVPTTLSWLNDSQNNPVAVLLRDVDGSILDFACAVDAFPLMMPELAGPGANEWMGPPMLPNQLGARSYQRVGISDHNNAADWVITNATVGILNPGLRLPMTGSPVRIATTPNVINFIDGDWAGNLSVETSGATVVVRADDGNGHSGESNPFYISAGPLLSLHLMSATHEGSSGVHGQQSVSIPLALSTNLEVLLTSQLPEEVSVPDRVVISAGQTSVLFDIRNFNDPHLDGSRSVLIKATAPGFTSTSATVTNYDDETASLIIATPATVTEGSGRLLAAGTIFANAPPTLPIAVQLTSSDPSRLQVPPTVYLLTGQTSTVFDLTVVDNRFFEEPASVTVRGSVSGWMMGESVTLLHDNESTNLQVITPTQLFEGSVGVTSGVVRLAAALSTNLQIALNSSRPDSVAVPAAVTIPAGQTSAVFNVTIFNDTLPETNRTARLTAAANRFGQSVTQLTVLDDDVGTFFFERISDNQIAGSAFPVIIYAQNKETYTIPSYNGMASIRATGAWGDVPVEPATIGPFINGTWAGSIRVMAESPATKLVAQHANGGTAESNPFDVAAASVTNLAVSDLAYDPVRQKLWAGLLPAAGTNGSVVRIDPASGAQEFAIALNNHPGKLAISDNSQYLYVGLNTTGGVARINLMSQTIDLRFGLGPDEPTFGTLFADDMDVVPGRPQTLLVSRRVNFGGYNQGVAAYDNGVQRPDMVGPAEYGSGYRISTFDSPTNFYFAFPTGLRRLVIGPTGVSIAQEFRGNQYGSDMEFDGQLSYGTSGEVFDPYRFRILGRFGVSGWVRPVPWAGRVFFLHENQLEGFDTRSYLPVGKVAIAGVSGAPVNLIHAGSNRLAFATTSGQLVILNTKMILPSAGSDLSLSQSVNSISPKVGEDFIYTISISNRGPALATNVVVGDWLGNEVKFISAAASKGACTLTNQILQCAIGELSSGESAVITLTVSPQRPGQFANVVRVTGGALGLNDDFNRRTDVAMFGTNLPSITVIDLNANDLAYDPTMNTLWASVSSSGGNLIPSLRAIDLGTGLESDAVPLTRAPGQLAISSNGRYLYAGLTNGQIITRFDTVSRTFGAEFALGGFTDMEVLPQTPTAIAVAFGRGMGVYENGVYRGGSHPDLNAVVIEFGDSNSLLYGVPHGPPGYLYRLGMTNYSIALIDVTEGLFNGWGADVKKGSNRLFAADGNVINPVTMSRVARLPVAGQVCPDSRLGLVFYLSQVDGTNWALTAFHENTLQLAGSYAIAGVRGFAGRLVRCKPGILAFSTSEGQIFILNTSAAGGQVSANLTLELVSPDGVTGDTGGHVEFTTHTENQGPAPAYGVTLTNHLSGPVELISVTLSRGTYTNLGDKVICHFGDLEPGTPVDAIVRVTGTNGGSVTNVAIVGHSGLDPVPANNLVVTHANFIRVPVGDVSIREIRSASETSVGASTQVSIVVTNHGRDEVPNVILTYTVPAGVVVESGEASQGTVTIGEPVSVSFGTISYGATAEVSMTIRPSYAGLLVNRARLSPSRHDRDSSNNEAVSIISVTGQSTSNLLQQFTLPAADIVYDATRQQIFASLQPELHQLSNSVVGLSLVNGSLSNVVRLREPVGLLAISDNGQYVYAERTTTGGISRINVPLNNADLDFELWPADGPRYGNVGDMEVVPGEARVLAVSVRSGQANVGLLIFDDGVPRPSSGPGGTFGGVYNLTFAGAATIYQTVPPSVFRRLSVDASGVGLIEEVSNLLPAGAFEHDGGLVYSRSGRVIDPVAKTIVRQYQASGFVAPDAANGRVYFLTQAGTPFTGPLLTLRAFNSQNTNELWALSIPARSGGGMKLIKLGTNGLAVLTDAGRIFVLKPSEIAQPSADLTITQIVSANPVTVNDTVTNTITLRNEGPWTASAVTFTNRISSGTTFLSVTSNIGSCTYSDGLITCSLGTMNSGASRTITTRFSPHVAVMAMTNVGGVYAAEIDPNPTNNYLTTVFAVSTQPGASMPDLFLREGSAFTSLQSRVRLSMSSSQSIVVRYETSDGTAIAGQDYTASSGTLSFAPGVTNRSISINAVVRGNTTVQSNRYFFINLSATNIAQPVYQAKVTIIEDDFIALSANNVSVSEGASGVTNAVFSVILHPAATEPVTVDYAAMSGSALIGEDLQARAGTLVFPPGVTNKIISIGVFGDNSFEPDEEFVLLLSSPSGALLSANQATGRILNDDVISTPSISALSVEGATVALRFSTLAGQLYRIERSDGLAPPNWVVLREMVGTGSETEVTDTVDAAEPQQFYRLVVP